jgi:mono/diheme cytochrome c family protein
MIKVVKPTLFFSAALLLVVAGLAMAQGQPSGNIKTAPIQPTSATSGQEMYNSYCAVCHGKDAKGNGPAAPQLKQQPADLTTLAKRHDGKYPDEYVTSVLRFGAKSPTHGSSEMPVWGPLLSAVSNRDKAQVEVRIANLNRYLKSLQVK